MEKYIISLQEGFWEVKDSDVSDFPEKFFPLSPTLPNYVFVAKPMYVQSSLDDESFRESSAADQWLADNVRLTKMVDGIRMDAHTRELTKREALYKTWTAQVFSPLCASIREKLALNPVIYHEAGMQLYEAFLAYCNDPYTVLSVDYISERYDPLAITRSHSCSVHIKRLEDPLFLDAQKRDGERWMTHPDWPFLTYETTALQKSFRESQKGSRKASPP